MSWPGSYRAAVVRRRLPGRGINTGSLWFRRYLSWASPMASALKVALQVPAGSSQGMGTPVREFRDRQQQAAPPSGPQPSAVASACTLQSRRRPPSPPPSPQGLGTSQKTGLGVPCRGGGSHRATVLGFLEGRALVQVESGPMRLVKASALFAGLLPSLRATRSMSWHGGLCSLGLLGVRWTKRRAARCGSWRHPLSLPA